MVRLFKIMASNRLVPLWKRKIPRYPLYLKGNPQNRVFLCQFWMKMIKPEKDNPPGNVKFIVHPQMSKFDIKQYLEKIYKVPVLTVKTSLKEGKFINDPIKTDSSVSKEDDYKVAHVSLADGHTFEFPDLHDGAPSRYTDEWEQLQQKKRNDIVGMHHEWERMALPPWFR